MLAKTVIPATRRIPVNFEAIKVRKIYAFLEWVRCTASTRSERIFLALSSSDLLDLLSVRPARLMKKVSILIPEPGPLGETFFEARERAIVFASLVNRPSGG